MRFGRVNHFKSKYFFILFFSFLGENTLPFKSLWLFFFFVFFMFWKKSLLLTKAAFIWSIYSKNSNIVKMYSNLTFFKSEYTLKCSLFLWCSAEFSASLLQSSVSHDHSEIILIYWFAAQETFLRVISVENSCAASYFKHDQMYFVIN